MTYTVISTHNPKKSLSKILALAVLAMSTSLSTAHGAESFGSHDSQKSNQSDHTILEGTCTPVSDSSRPIFEDRVDTTLAKALNDPDLLHQHSYGTHNKTVAGLRKTARDLRTELDKAKKCQIQIDELKIQLDTNAIKLDEIGSGNQISPLSKLEEQITSLLDLIASFSQVPEELKQSIESMINQHKVEMGKFKKYDDDLSTAKENLERELKDAREQFEGIIKPYGEFSYLEIHTNDAIDDLMFAYAKHTMGPLGENLLTTDVVAKLLKTYENCSISIGSVDAERLYQLLARSLELPYYLCQDQKDKIEEWVEHAEKLNKHLKLRLMDEVFALNFGLQLSKTCQFDLVNGHQEYFIGKKNSELSKIVTGVSIDFSVANENHPANNMTLLNTIIGSYGDDIILPEKFNTDLMKDFGGCFGLCIESLSGDPVSSWTNPSSMSGINLFKNHIQTEHNASDALTDMILQIVGQHVNVAVVDFMIANMKKSQETEIMKKSFRKGSVNNQSPKNNDYI